MYYLKFQKYKSMSAIQEKIVQLQIWSPPPKKKKKKQLQLSRMTGILM